MSSCVVLGVWLELNHDSAICWSEPFTSGSLRGDRGPGPKAGGWYEKTQAWACYALWLKPEYTCFAINKDTV